MSFSLHPVRARTRHQVSRDKFAAWRRKGMWMGTIIPLGREKPETGGEHRGGRNAFACVKVYLDLACVSALQEDLECRGLRSKSGDPISSKVRAEIISRSRYSHGGLQPFGVMPRRSQPITLLRSPHTPVGWLTWAFYVFLRARVDCMSASFCLSLTRLTKRG